jgi:phosphoglycerol transferase
VVITAGTGSLGDVTPARRPPAGLAAELPPLKSTAIEAGIAALVSLLLSLLAIGPLLGRLDRAWSTGDMLAQYTTSQTWSWISFSPTQHFGYPAGLDYNYWPNGDLLENAFTHAVGVLSGSPFVGVNLLILLSFPIAAALAAVLLRLVRFGGPLSVAFAVVIAMLPYHWARALMHTYLATTISMMTGLILVLLVASGRLPLLVGGASRGRRAAGWLALAALVLATAWMGVYYAVFSILLGLAAVLWRFLKGDGWRRLLAGLGVFAAIGVLAGATQAVLVLARTQGPVLDAVAERGVVHSYYLAGSLITALLPWPVSLVDGYNTWVEGWLDGAPPYEPTGVGNFGTVVTTAALLLFLGALAWRARRGVPVSPPDRSGVTPGLIGWLLAATLAFFIPWGLNIAFALAASPSIRAWNRLLPALLTLVVLGAAVVLRERASSGRAALWGAALVILVTALDVVVPASSTFANTAKQSIAVTDRARAYADDVNAALPDRCAILQLPVREFPEPVIQDGPDHGYGHLWQSLTNADKDFTYGAVKGTSAAAQQYAISDPPTRAQLDGLEAAGICGVHVDLAAYPDVEAASLATLLTSRFGEPIAVDDVDRWSTWRTTVQDGA